MERHLVFTRQDELLAKRKEIEQPYAQIKTMEEGGEEQKNSLIRYAWVRDEVHDLTL